MSDLIKSFWAGIMIGLGGVAYLSCSDKTIGSFLFSIGLFAVLIFEFNLYTGKVCDCKYLMKPLALLNILICNLLSAACLGFLVCDHPGLSEAARQIVSNKLAKPWITVYIDALLCGVFIGVAVHGYKKAHGYPIVLLGVMGFILTGSEHVIADMFYFSVAQVGKMTDLIMFIILAALGNTVGGALFGVSLKLGGERNECDC